MSDSEPEIPTPDAPLGPMADRVISRRKVVQAGLIAVPVLMTLPSVPAWSEAVSTVSTCKNPTANPRTASCAEIAAKRAAGFKANGSTAPVGDAFGKNVFGDTTPKNPF